MKRWTNEQLAEYITNFTRDEAREQVLKAILDSEKLKEAIESEVGSQILNAAVDIIRDSVLQIVSSALKEDDVVVLRKSAMEIRTAHKQMVLWATIIAQGQEHINKM